MNLTFELRFKVDLITSRQKRQLIDMEDIKVKQFDEQNEKEG